MESVIRPGTPSNVVSFPAERASRSARRSNPPRPAKTGAKLVFARPTRSTGRLVCEVCGEFEGECIPGLHTIADEDRAARIREQAEAIALAGKLASSSAPTVVVELTPDLFEQWKREVGAVVGDKWWTTRGYHYGHIAKHFASLAGLASDALHVTFKT
ncbi:MAG: hypothetical protein ACRELB_23400, partial [Polyangiaceae bacterium]